MDSITENVTPRHRRDDGAYRRIEVITGTARRRRWSAEEKAAVVAESFRQDINVSALARRVGVSRGLLQTWRRAALDASGASEPTFVPVHVEDAASGPETPSATRAPKTEAVATDASPSGTIEIETGDVRIRVHGSVDMSALQAVLSRVGRRR